MGPLGRLVGFLGLLKCAELVLGLLEKSFEFRDPRSVILGCRSRLNVGVAGLGLGSQPLGVWGTILLIFNTQYKSLSGGVGGASPTFAQWRQANQRGHAHGQRRRSR
ncbi:hypothetical protein FB45DRAFT_954871 [Roridomyces roridus]|uniref:Uncharacterized protein n=1 Tax=Roridomyces roridus TaxID=1738132 RepID=A0AAD7F9A6_9AGAR|nr:hypothetical protein FB45DRAFT_954871 [Roridomyces roridus]